ncbi:MAG: hypothetical protein V3S24_19650, partial [Candidatus Tectomicrobia bacterium]
RRAAAAKTTAAVRGTPAEVDGLSNGGAGQKGRLECLYICRTLRLRRSRQQERGTSGRCLLSPAADCSA